MGERQAPDAAVANTYLRLKNSDAFILANRHNRCVTNDQWPHNATVHTKEPEKNKSKRWTEKNMEKMNIVNN